MNLSVCTISFRHHLTSLEQIASWAARSGFEGIELWGVHAQNLAEQGNYDITWLRSFGLSVPMLSDYLPLQGERDVAVQKTTQLCRLAQSWGAKKVRTFAGNRGSAQVSNEQRTDWVMRMRELCRVADAHGISLVVETHPGTLADNPNSTLRLVEEIDHPALRFNFDVIHVWEGGSDPAEFLRLLEPLVVHMHVKNVAAPELLSVFLPANVYAPSGVRTGMVPLFEGAFDYSQFLHFVMMRSNLWDTLDISLEWFGPRVTSTLRDDRTELRKLEARYLRAPAALLNPPRQLA